MDFSSKKAKKQKSNMPQIALKPIIDDDKFADALEKEIKKVIMQEIFAPLIEILGVKKKQIQNTRDDLIKAIQSGQIVYHRGKFKGKLNATLSRELRRIGAEWDRVQGAWSIPQSLLPVEVKNAIALSETKFTQLVSKLEKKIQEIDPVKIAEKMEIKKIFDASLSKIDKDFQQTIKNITVAPDTRPEVMSRISDEYVNATKFDIVNFTTEEITALREKFQKRVFEGYRYEGVIETIRKTYEVSESRAKLIARQETKLMTVKYKQIRFEEVGITRYRWSTVGGTAAHPVRDDHKALEGKIFSFQDPPIVDTRRNRRGNPGEDYNCRCVAIPLMDFE